MIECIGNYRDRSGDIIVDPNPTKSFDTAIYPDRKIIVFLFAEDSGTGAYAITKDEYCKNKSNCKIKCSGLYYFRRSRWIADNDLVEQKVSFIDGGVNVGNATPTKEQHQQIQLRRQNQLRLRPPGHRYRQTHRQTHRQIHRYQAI